MTKNKFIDYKGKKYEVLKEKAYKEFVNDASFERDFVLALTLHEIKPATYKGIEIETLRFKLACRLMRTLTTTQEEQTQLAYIQEIFDAGVQALKEQCDKLITGGQDE
jgi:hypothetical protein